MKKWKLLLLCLLCLALAGSAAGETGSAPEAFPRVILYGVYSPEAGSDRIAVGCLDAGGNVWIAEQADLSWSGSVEAVEELLAERRGMNLSENVLDDTYDGYSLTASWLRDLAIMADTVPVQEGEPAETGAGGSCRAVYALRTGRDGSPESVLLGMGGSLLFENADPGAQMMYRWMWRKLSLMEIFFSDAGYAEEGIEPHGFEAIPLREFFGLADGAEEAELTVKMTDCEEGFTEVNLPQVQLDDIRLLAARGVVTGKRNAMSTTGGTLLCGFSDARGQSLGWLEFYETEPDGNGSRELLAVAPDGMYSVSVLLTPVDTLPEAEQRLLAFTLEGMEYTVGKTTPRDLIHDGWQCFPEWIGPMTFSRGDAEFTMQVITAGCSLDEPIMSVYLEDAENMAPYGFGFDGIITEENPDAKLTLSDGRTLSISTWDSSVQIFLLETGKAQADEPDEE